MISLSIALLTLTTTSWTYAGFVADPTSFPPQSLPPAVTPAAPSTPEPPSPAAPPSIPVESPSATPEPKPEPAVPPVAAAPTQNEVRYRLADGRGQLWEHADPIALQAFVQDRNRQLFEVRPSWVPLVRPSWR